MDTAPQVQQQHAPLAVVAVDIIRTHHTQTRTRILRPLQREAVQVEIVVQQEVQNLDGQEQVHQFSIQWLRFKL